MTDLINRKQNVDQRNPGLADPLIQAGAIAVDQNAYSTIPDSTPLDRVYKVKGISDMYIEIENTGSTENGLIYRIDNSRKEFKFISELVDGDFDSEIKGDTTVAAGIEASATVTMAAPVSNVFSNATITTLGVTGDVFATGTATLLAVTAGDTVTINGLLYTAVTGVKANNTEFSVDGTDTVDAADLADSINNDVRSGTLGDVSATSSLGVVTITSNVLGTAGNATTLAETGTTITISGAIFTGGINGDTVTVNGLVYLAVAHTAADSTQFDVTGGDTADATALGVAIGSDGRTGTIGDITESHSTNVVTVRSTLLGVAGDVVTLVSSNGVRLAVTGSGNLANGVDADIVTINGLVYTCVETKVNNTQFTDFSNDSAALDLSDSVNADTRIGTLGDVKASRVSAIVTLESTQSGVEFNAITLTSSDGTRLAVSGPLFTGGTNGQIVSDAIVDISPETTAMRISIKRETSGQDTTVAGIVSVT